MTAGVKPYAKLVLDLLDKHGVLKARFYRESCTKTATGLLVKDLGRLEPRPEANHCGGQLPERLPVAPGARH